MAEATSAPVRGTRRGAWGSATWRWTPLACAAFYVVVLLATLPSVVGAIYRNADVAAAPEIAQLSAKAPDLSLQLAAKLLPAA